MTAIRVSGVAIGNGRVFMAGAMPVCLMPIVMLVRLNLDRPHGARRRTEHGRRHRAPDGEQYRKAEQQPDSEHSHNS